MAKAQNKPNGLYVLMGLFFLVCYFIPDKEDVHTDELVTKTLIVHGDILNASGRNSPNAYRFYADSFPCSFVIKKAGGMAANRQNLKNIHKGDTLIVKIYSGSLNDLDDKLADIPIYDLQKNGQQIYTLNAYNQAQHKYDTRWRIILICAAVLLILRGTTLITSKVAVILGIATFLALLAARFFYAGW